MKQYQNIDLLATMFSINISTNTFYIDKNNRFHKILYTGIGTLPH